MADESTPDSASISASDSAPRPDPTIPAADATPLDSAGVDANSLGAPGADTSGDDVSQAEIDAVMAAMNEAAKPPTEAADLTAAPPGDGLDDVSIDELLKSASFDDASSMPDAAPAAVVPTQSFDLPNFQEVLQEAAVSSIDLLRDVELNVKIELGRSRMLVEDVLKLGEGSVVELDKLAGDPVDVFVNNRLVARGEVLVLNDNFCVRVNEIVAGAKEELA